LISSHWKKNRKKVPIFQKYRWLNREFSVSDEILFTRPWSATVLSHASSEFKLDFRAFSGQGLGAKKMTYRASACLMVSSACFRVHP